MPDSDIADRLTRCFLSYFTGLSAQEVPRSSMATVGEWDSLASVTLVTLVSEEFGIEVPPDAFENFVSYELILHYLENNKHVSSRQ